MKRKNLTIDEIMSEHRNEFYKAFIIRTNMQELFIPCFIVDVYCYGVLVNTKFQSQKKTKRRIDERKYKYEPNKIDLFEIYRSLKFVWAIHKKITELGINDIKEIDKELNIYQKIKEISSVKFDRKSYNKNISLDNYRDEKRRILFQP